MARIRSVHPDICTSEPMSRVSAQVERTFVRLWTHCDDAGRCVDNARLLKAALYPLHDDVTAEDIDHELEVLFAAGLIVRYEIDGGRFIAVRSWDEFQHPQKPRPSKVPEPSATSTRQVRDTSGTDTGSDPDATSTRHVREQYGPGVEGSGEGGERETGEGEHGCADRTLDDALARHRWPRPTTRSEIDQLAQLRATIPELTIIEALDAAGPDQWPRDVAKRARALHAETPPASHTFEPGDPDCPRCQGRGSFPNGHGTQQQCSCTRTPVEDTVPLEQASA